ncbi:MAG: aspartate kinase [Planctomycetota bacterium]|jgi:aspartate kinase|nr:aspartate kinase [Planctomycetota bacterium]MDP7636533.1 aspartate kinase [Phycisphaerae bacterium]
MSIVVMKFGGTSLADADKIRSAARRAIRSQKQGHQVVIVVSAMGKATDQLEGMARQVMRGSAAPKREMDQLLATGEQVTISLTAMALEEMGAAAISFTAGQIGIITDDKHTRARIKTIDARRIHEQLDAGRIVIVTGFQGVTERGHVTTLGRGGSNVTLVALAVALGAEVCENYTDVDGIFTADPRIVPNARKINKVSYDEMLELASLGAGVLHNRAVEFAKKYNVPIHVRSSMNNKKGTMIVAESESMERIVVSGVALKDKLARISLHNVPDQPGVAAHIFHTLATHNVVVDDIIQTVGEDGTAAVSFTADPGDLDDARVACEKLATTLKCDVVYEDHLAKVSVVGVGMRTHTGVAEKMFAALAHAKINIQNITTSEIKISCLIDRAQGAAALRVVHDAFELGGRKKPARKTRKIAPARPGKRSNHTRERPT